MPFSVYANGDRIGTRRTDLAGWQSLQQVARWLTPPRSVF